MFQWVFGHISTAHAQKRQLLSFHLKYDKALRFCDLDYPQEENTSMMAKYLQLFWDIFLCACIDMGLLLLLVQNLCHPLLSDIDFL